MTMRIAAILAALLAVLTMAIPMVVAQELDPVAPSPGKENAKPESILLVAQPVAPVAVAGGSPVEVEFRVTGQGGEERQGADIPGLGEIRLRGVASASLAGDGPPEVQLLVTEIERSGALAPLSGFGSTWRADDEDDLVLSLSDEVEIEGDRRSLSEALAALDEAGGSAAGGSGEELRVQTSGQESTQGASSGTGGTGDAGGSDGVAGGPASDYTQPAPVEAEADAVVETRETKTGCAPRVDLALRVAIDQIRDETYTDGKLTETGECYDSYHEGDKYPLERDYSACPVRIDLGGLTATGRFRWFYRNGAASRIDVATGSASCVDDPTRTYAITEDHAACKVAVDYTAMTATPQARLVYEGGDGTAVEVRACRPSTTREAVPLTLNASICPQPESGRQMVAHTYTIDGVLHQPDVCAPSGTTIESRTEYADCGVRIDLTLGVAFRQVRDRTIQNGEQTKQTECYDSYEAGDRFRLERDHAACEVDVDLAARTATGHFRLRYTGADGETRDARECSPDPDRVHAIFEAHDCAIEHANGMAIQRSRLVYQTRDGNKHQVRACGPSEDPARAPVAMTFNTAVCDNPDGSTATRSFREQGRYEYALDGITRTHGECRNTGRRIEYRADFEACRVEIDEENETVFKRFKIETVIDDSVSAASSCMKSAAEPGNSPMTRDYAACPDTVDYSGMRKTYRFRHTYEDPHSRRMTTLTCRDDAEQSFALLEDFEACATEHDLEAMTAVPQSRIIYRKGDGTAVEVRACQSSPTREAAAITEEHDGCALAFEAGRAIPQARLVYTRDGRRVEARGCAASLSRSAIAMTFNTDRCDNRRPAADIAFDGKGAFTFREMGIYEYEIDGETRSWGKCRETGREIEFTRRSSCEGGSGGTIWDFEGMRVTQRFGIQIVARDAGTKAALEIIETTNGPCFTSDDYKSWPLTIDYDSRICPDRVDFTTMRYTPRGYVSAARPASQGGLIQANPSCRDGRTYAITEDHEACEIATDKAKGKAIPQSRMVYTDADGGIHEARACQASESRGEIPLVRNTELCSIRPGNEDGIFKEKAAWTYKIGATVHTASECEETGVTVEYKTDYGGCDIRIDHQLKAAIRQVKKQTFRDSVKIAESGCQDSARLADRFAFERSYSACEIVTDLETSTATTYFKWIYTDHGGNQQTVTGASGANGQNCVADPDRTYTITEDHESCTHNIDYNELEVTPQARLVYRTEDGRDHEVRGCEDSLSRDAVDLVKRPDLCNKEHDLAASKSHQLSKHIYSIGGLTYQADTCTQTGVSYAHEKHYGDCEPIVDRGNKLVTRQYQVRIRVNGIHEYVVSSCTADPNSARIPIESTTDGCNDPEFWIHDISAGISYGLHRLYYIESGSNLRTYVTANCVASEETYRHDVETVGYQNHDDERFGYALSRVSISTKDGVHVIRESEVLPGSPKIDYVLDRTVDLPPTEKKAGDRTYEGCNAFDRTDRTEIRTRPDGSEHMAVIGDGDPIGPTYVCDFQVTDWTLKPDDQGRLTTTNTRGCGDFRCHREDKDGNCLTPGHTKQREFRIGTYQARRNLTREDRTVISHTSATRSYELGGSCHYRGFNSAAPQLPDPLSDTSAIGRWLDELGWR